MSSPRPTAQSEADKSSFQASVSPCCTKGRVVVISCDAFRGRYLGQVLQSAGHAVAITSEVQTALEILAADTQAAVLIVSPLNRRIERLYEICLTLRRTAPRLPLIVVGPNDVEAKIKFLGLESDDYVVEPFDPTEFLARIKSWIRRQYAESP
jgi:two-component system, OmpR family, copper resistance phosphate regulon response regulator CusR